MDVWILADGVDRDEADALLEVPGASTVIAVFSSKEAALEFLPKYMIGWDQGDDVDRLRWVELAPGGSMDAFLGDSEYPRFLLRRERVDPLIESFEDIRNERIRQRKLN